MPGKKLEMKHLRSVVSQIVTALQYTKNQGVIHCDIKPENILYKNFTLSDIKVIDFGSSVFINDTGYSYLQTRPYRAPELIFGCDFNFVADMWSLGCVIYEMVTSAMLFNNKTIEENIALMTAISKNTSLSVFADGKYYASYVQENLVCRTNKNTNNIYEIEVILPKENYSIDKILQQHKAAPDLIDFVKKCLVLDPSKRMSVEEALNHRFLKNK